MKIVLDHGKGRVSGGEFMHLGVLVSRQDDGSIELSQDLHVRACYVDWGCRAVWPHASGTHLSAPASARLTPHPHPADPL